MAQDKLPRGIYHEAKKNRYRVRLYRNNCTFLGGYFPTLELAIVEWKKLSVRIRAIPKLARNQKEERSVYEPTFSGILATISEDLIRAPGSKRIAKK